MRLFRKICILSLCLVLIGIPFYSSAKSYFVGGQVSGGGGTLAPWSTWDEGSQETLTGVDYCCFFDDVNNGASEIGYSASGSVTGSDLVLTAVGTPAGATPGTVGRTMDELDDKFTFTTGLMNGALASTTYTVILKVTNIGAGKTKGFFNFQDVALGEMSDISDNLYVVCADSAGTNRLVYTSTASLPTSGTVYVAIWADGINKVRAGFSTVRPTKLSDFTEYEDGDTTCSWSRTYTSAAKSTVAGNTRLSYVGVGTVKYIIMTRSCLIDNAS